MQPNTPSVATSSSTSSATSEEAKTLSSAAVASSAATNEGHISDLVRKIGTAVGTYNSNNLKTTIENLANCNNSILTSTDDTKVFDQRFSSMAALLSIYEKNASFINSLSLTCHYNLQKVLRIFLDDYLYHQIIHAESLPVISEKQRIEYIDIFRGRTDVCIQLENTTAYLYELNLTIEQLKAIRTEKGFLGQGWRRIKQAHAGEGLIGAFVEVFKFGFGMLHNTPELWYARIWAIRNMSRLLLGNPTEKLFHQLISYIRYMLENITINKWEVGYTIGEVLTEIISRCPIERLRTLAFYNQIDHQNQTPIYHEDGDEEKKTSAKSPGIYLDLMSLLDECTKDQSQRCPAFSNDAALFSTVNGLLTILATTDDTSWLYYFAAKQWQKLKTEVNDARTLTQRAANTVCFSQPFLGAFLKDKSIQRPKAINIHVTPMQLALPFTDTAIVLPEIKATTEISKSLIIAYQYFNNGQYADFIKTAHDLYQNYCSNSKEFTREEISAYLACMHKLADLILASGAIAEAKQHYDSFILADTLAQTTNFYCHAGDNYLKKALIGSQGYFASESLYEYALAAFLKAKALEAKPTVQPRIDFLRAEVEFWHLYHNLEQEVTTYALRQEPLPLPTVLQRIRPLASKLQQLEYKFDHKITALYNLLESNINKFVATFIDPSRKVIKTPTDADYKTIATIGKQLQTHGQFTMAKLVFRIDPTRFQAAINECDEETRCANEFKDADIFALATFSPVININELAAGVQTIISNTCKEVIAELANPMNFDFAILVFGNLSAGTLQLHDKINLALLIKNGDERFSNYFRELLALLKIRLQLIFYPHFDFGHLQYPGCLELIKTPDELAAYCYAKDDEHEQKLQVAASTTRYQLLRPTIIYPNTDSALVAAYVSKITAIKNAKQENCNQLLAVQWLSRHAQLDMTKLATLRYFLTDLALYYDIAKADILEIIAALQAKNIFAPEFLKQLATEAKALLAGQDIGYVIPALPLIANIWIQHLIFPLTFDPMLEAWKIKVKNRNVMVNEAMVIALAKYLVKNLRCLEIKNHRLAFHKIPDELRQRYYATLKESCRELSLTTEEKATVAKILGAVGEITDSCGNCTGLKDREQNFLQVLNNDLSIALTEAKSSKAQNHIVIEWMEGEQKTQRLLKPAIANQLFDAQLQPNKNSPQREGVDEKRLVIHVLNEQKEKCAYVKFFPERPGVEFQVDALIRRITGYALIWKLCRVVVTSNNQTTVYPLLISEPSGYKLTETKGEELLRHLDDKTYSLFLISRMLISPEDDKLSNFVIHEYCAANLKTATRIIGVDNDHAFEQAVLKDEHGEEKVNIKSHLFTDHKEMFKVINPAVTKRFCQLNSLGIVQLWQNEVQEYDRLHIRREHITLYFRKTRPRDLAEYKNSYIFLNPELLYVTPEQTVVPVTITDAKKLEQNLNELNPNKAAKVFLNLSEVQNIITANGGHTPAETIGLFSFVGENSEIETLYQAGSYIPVLQIPAIAKTVQQRMVQIQNIFRKTCVVKRIDLISTMGGQIDKHYRKAAALPLPPQQSFDAKVPSNYQKINNRVVSSSTNKLRVYEVYASTAINVKQAAALREVFAEFKQPGYPARVQQQINDELHQAYLSCRFDDLIATVSNGDMGTLERAPEAVAAKIIGKINFASLSDTVCFMILKTLARRRIGFEVLSLAGCKVLTDDHLTNLLENLKVASLLYLDLSNCPRLTASVLEVVAKTCPYLKTLVLNGTSIEFIGKKFLWLSSPIEFPELTELEAENCQVLTAVNLNAPNLSSCRLGGCPNLASLNLKQTYLLRLLALPDSNKVAHYKFFIKYPFLAMCNLNNFTAAFVATLDEKLTEIKDGLAINWQSCSGEVLKVISTMLIDYIAESDELSRQLLGLDLDESVVTVLGDIGRCDATIVSRLGFAALDSQDSSVRLSAMETLGKLEKLGKITLQGRDAWNHNLVGGYIGYIDEKPKIIKCSLFQALLGENRYEQSRAAKILVSLEKSTPELTNELINDLIHALARRRNCFERSNVAAALGKLGKTTPEVINALIYALGVEDKYFDLRSRAVETLDQPGKVTPEAIDALVTALSNKNNYTASAAAEALKEISKNSIQIFKQIRSILNQRKITFKNQIFCLAYEYKTQLKSFAAEIFAKVRPLVKQPEFITTFDEANYQTTIIAATKLDPDLATIVTSYLMQASTPATTSENMSSDTVATATATSSTSDKTTSTTGNITSTTTTTTTTTTTSANKLLDWNCFDVAIGLADLLKIDVTTHPAREEKARKQLVKEVLAKSGDVTYRKLLAPEIRHAAAITALYLNRQAEAKMDTKQELSNQTHQQYLCELFSFAEALAGTAEQKVVTAKITQELAEPSNIDSNVTQDLYLNSLPEPMQIQAQKLINDYCTAMQKIDAHMLGWNSELKAHEGHIFQFDELRQFFLLSSNQQKYAKIFAEFTTQEKLYLPHETALQDYCEKKETYETYLDLYYGKNQWYAFQRSFSGETTTSMIDVTALHLGCKIVIQDKDSKPIYQTNNSNIEKGVKKVTYNGRNHFMAYLETAAVTTQLATSTAMSSSSSSSGSYTVAPAPVVSASLASFFRPTTRAATSTSSTVTLSVATTPSVNPS